MYICPHAFEVCKVVEMSNSADVNNVNTLVKKKTSMWIFHINYSFKCIFVVKVPGYATDCLGTNFEMCFAKAKNNMANYKITVRSH